MFKKIIDFYKKNQEVINYLIVGGIGTVISIASFTILLNLSVETVTSNIISWIITVVVMYILNRYFVFTKHAKGLKKIVLEILSFVSARIFTLVLETIIVWLGIDVMHLNAVLIKILAQILVIVLNYVASKLFIFKDSGNTSDKADNVRKNSSDRKTKNIKN